MESVAACLTGGAVSAAPPAAVLSPSQVRTFMDCQSRWYFRYVLGLPDPANSNLALGIAVHGALASNFEQKIDSRKDLPAGEVASLFQHAWAVASEDAVLRDDENPQEIAASGEGLVRKYMDEAAPAIQPVSVELEVEGEIAGVRVRGRVDLIDESGRIVDIKTAGRKPNGISMEQSFQLATYEQLAPGNSGRVRIDALVKTKTPQLVQFSRTITDADRRATQTIYPLAQEAMRSGLYMPNRTSMLCSRRNCAYWRDCEAEFGGTVEAS